MTPAVLLMVFNMAAGVFVPGWSQKAPAPEVGLTGCLEEGTAPETFVLLNARHNPEDPLEKSTDYFVTAVAPLELEGYVNRSVRLLGVIKETDAAPSGDSEATGARFATLNAKELKAAADTCPEYDTSSSSGGRIRFGDLGSAGMSGGGWPQMSGSLAGQSSLKSDLLPDLFAGIAGGYRISQVAGVASSQKTNALDTGETTIDDAGPTHTSGWVGSYGPAQTSGWVDTSFAPTSTAGLLGPVNNIPADSVGPAIAVNAAAADLGVDLSGVADPFAVSNGPAPIPNPEPASLILFGTGLVGVAMVARRRRARRTAAAA